MSDIEKKCTAIRKSGDCYVLLFEPMQSEEGMNLSGIFSTTKSIEQIGCIEATDGKKTEVFYFTADGLQTYLRYTGREPSWLERKKLGIKPVPIRNVSRLLNSSGEEEWMECRRRFAKIRNQITNLSEPGSGGNVG